MIHIGRGPRATMSSFLDDLMRTMEDRQAPDLAHPILVVVPSAALKRHLTVKILQRFGGAVLGLEILEPFQVASSILSAAGQQPPAMDPGLLSIIVRREAAKRPTLNSLLSEFDDGHALCTSSVRDLLSAGLAAENSESCRQALSQDLDEELVARGKELIDLTLSVFDQLATMGIERTSHMYRRATSALQANPNAVLRSSQVFVFGFGDAPGQTTKFLRSLIDSMQGTLHLDLPPDITDPTQESPGAPFARAFAKHLGFDQTDLDAVTATRTLPGRWQGVSSVGTNAEVKEVAYLVASLIDAGTQPQEIGIVVRDMESYLPELRTQFEDMGIPFKGDALTAGFHPYRTSVMAIVEFLRTGVDLPLDHFMALVGPRLAALESPVNLSCVDLMLRETNLQTVKDLLTRDSANPQAPTSSPNLPFTVGLDKKDSCWRRRKIASPRESFGLLVSTARTLISWFDKQEPRSVEVWVKGLRELLFDSLGWRHAQTLAPFEEKISKLGESFENLDLPVNLAEFKHIFESMTEGLLEVPVGTTGNGVAILTLEKARSLTFSSVFVLGTNRGNYPRLGREDPVLCDDIRSRLSQTLPQLGSHRSRVNEENYLFAQLLESATDITLSWQRADCNGKVSARSPFIDRLELEKGRFRSEDVPRDFNDRIDRDQELGRPISIMDASVWAGLNGNRDLQERTKARLLKEVTHLDPRLAAQGLNDVVIELDPNLSDQKESKRLNDMSPWFGNVGQDSRSTLTYVTTLEKTARCPWQAFISRILGLELPPDPWNQLADLNPLIIGNTIHIGLEILTAPDSDAACGNRPSPEDIEKSAHKAARRVLDNQDIDLQGLAHVLAEISIPFMTRAFDLDWQDGCAPRVEETEGEGAVNIETQDGTWVSVHFRADRIDSADDQKILTDYKTGGSFSTAKRQDTRRKHLLNKIAAGELLQAAAYAISTEGTGRYVYLRPDLPDDRAIATVQNDDEVSPRFTTVVQRLLDSWHVGLFPPRLEDGAGDANKACEYCDLKAACLHGDSGARQRLSFLAASRKEVEATDLLANIWFLSEYVNSKVGDPS